MPFDARDPEVVEMFWQRKGPLRGQDERIAVCVSIVKSVLLDFPEAVEKYVL